MRKKIIYLALFAALCISCEEYYNPEMESVPGMMVVESNLTNDPHQNYVRLSMTQDFYSTSQEEKITGAKVELIQIYGETMTAIEQSSGYYTFSGTPVPGRNYMLRITYQEDIYESATVTMPPIPAIDTLYTLHKI